MTDLQIRNSRKLLQNPYAYLDGDGEFVEIARQLGVLTEKTSLLSVHHLLGDREKGGSFSKREIKVVARELHKRMWAQRAAIWPDRKDLAPIDILDPSVALQILGYRVDVHESLGQYESGGQMFEIAGTIDNQRQHVQLSRRFSTEIRNFTTAHELGHATLHEGTGLHRDRGLDGAFGSASRKETEVEADVFAAFFLMPGKQIREKFKRRYHTNHFTVSEATAFALISGNVADLEKKYRIRRDLARLLADTEYYNGCHFRSLASRFRVSVEAMAIRLEDLNLLSR